MTATDDTPNGSERRTPPHLAEPVLVRGLSGFTHDFYSAVVAGFLDDPVPGAYEIAAAAGQPERIRGFQVNGRWVATATSRNRTMVTPGGRVPVSAVTAVTVSPPYRRRGLLSAMLRSQLHDQSEPVALLWASEAAIYGRFGFGETTQAVRLELPTRESDFLPHIRLSDGSVDEVGGGDWIAHAPGIRAGLLSDRPGALERDRPQRERGLFDPEQRRDGAGALRHALHYAADGTPDGYASFRIKGQWPDDLPGYGLRIQELEAATSGAYARLWRYLLDMDLVRTVTFDDLPTDAPVLRMLANPRAARRRPVDATYARIVDIPAALGARRYAADLDLRLQITDSLFPANDRTVRLQIDDGTAHIRAADGDPDLGLDIRELGSLYLGGVRCTDLLAAGLVTEHTPGAAGVLDRAFLGSRTPHCPDHF